MKQRISISEGNTKMGSIPSVSLVPCATCAKDAPCRKLCYAMKAYRMYDATKAAYQRNTRLARRSPDAYFAEVKAYLAKHNPRFFRWHVAGDILDASYLDSMVSIANAFPQTRFLAFTKRYDFIAAYPTDFPANLSIVLSAWPGYPMDNPRGLPIAWMLPKDGSETRCPDSALRCPGDCETCGMCYSLRDIKRDVAFHQH